MELCPTVPSIKMDFNDNIDNSNYMETKFYTYANIIRVLKYDSSNYEKSIMIDVNLEENSILSVFDATKRPYDLIFINSFVNILNQSTVGFKQTFNKELQIIAVNAIRNKMPELCINYTNDSDITLG